ncbi:hypothetical protein BDZ88DRAFT_449396 [Geranomyces variabilis]|nr:hypothetical protein BDZ88DRAFT_449396 [Geranomyces variabilis]
MELLHSAPQHTPIIAKSSSSHVRDSSRASPTAVRQPPRPPVTPNDWRPKKSHGSAHQLNKGGKAAYSTTSHESLGVSAYRTPPQRRSDGDVVVYAISANRRSLSKRTSSGSVNSGGAGGGRLSVGGGATDGARTPAQRAESLSESRRSSINERKERTAPPSPRSANAARRSNNSLSPSSPYPSQQRRDEEDAESELSFVDDEFKRMVDQLGAEELNGSGGTGDGGGGGGNAGGHAAAKDREDGAFEGSGGSGRAGSGQRDAYENHDARRGANGGVLDSSGMNGHDRRGVVGYAGSITGYSEDVSHASLDRDLQHAFSDGQDPKHHFLSTPTLELLDAEFGRGDDDDELDFGDDDLNFGEGDSAGGLEDLDLTGLGPPLSKDNTRPSSPAWTEEDRAESVTTRSAPYSSMHGSRRTVNDSAEDDPAGSVTTRSAPYSSVHGSRRTVNESAEEHRGGSVTTRSAPYSSPQGSRRSINASGDLAHEQEFEQDDTMWDSPSVATPTPANYGRISSPTLTSTG